MRLIIATLLATLAAPALAPSALAQTAEVAFCATRDDAQLLAQAGPGAAMPQGCRTATVRRIDTPAGALCQIDIGNGGGIAGAVRDAVATTEWWLPCADLRAP
jgi:hypothetical protein